MENYFSQFLDVYIASDIRQIEVDTAEQLLDEFSSFEFEIAIANLK
jgi:hypothetical protein